MLLGPTLLERISALTRGPVVLAIALLAALAWAIQWTLRRRWSASRRRLLATQLATLRTSLFIAVLAWTAGHVLVLASAPEGVVLAVEFVDLVAWLSVGLRVGRVFFFAWLFAFSEREGVPLLLVDIFSIVATVVLFGALLHMVFLIEVTSLLATSAVVSVVLGLALQDTLGQLFAGVSLQLDRPFRLGDWVEVHTGGQRFSGQVLEISWRATLLLAIGEELVTIPNKTMAQGLVANFSGRERPFVRSHIFRFPLDVDVAKVKALLLQAASETDGLLRDPRPLPLLIEVAESWLTFKMVNFVTDYGAQYTVGDAYQSRALALLASHGIALATPRLELVRR